MFSSVYKGDKRVLLTDISERGGATIKHRTSYEVKPDKVLDFRKIRFPDNSFKMGSF